MVWWWSGQVNDDVRVKRVDFPGRSRREVKVIKAAAWYRVP